MGKRSTPPKDVLLLAAIYREHLRTVRWILRARGIASDELDDVVHDVFLGIHRRLPYRDVAVPLGSWVCGVARSVAFAHRRGAARRREAIAAVPEPDALRLPDEELARREAWQRLVDALAGLHDDQREAFVLVDVMGMRAAEAAELVDAPVNTVYSRLRLARRHCEEVLALPEQVDRAAWLRAAAQGDEPGEGKRRRAWNRIVAVLPAAASPVASSVITTWAIAGVAAVVVVSGIAVLAPPATSEVPHVAGAPAQRRAAVEVAVVPAKASSPVSASHEPAERSRAAVEARPSARTRVAAAAVAPASVDPLAEAVELLRNGKAELAAGNAAEALRAIDRYRTRFDEGPLARDVLRLERSAACATSDERRAMSAKSALVELALARPDEPACP